MKGLLYWCIICCVGPIFATESVFFPDRGMLFPDSMESDTQDIGHVFSNPSRIHHDTTNPVIKLENAPSFVGYNQMSLSGLYPIHDWTLFAGYLSFGNSELDHTVRDSITNRPIRAGNFAHTYQQVTLGAVYHLPKTPFRFSANIESASQTLDGDHVGGLGLGTGVQWTLDSHFWASVYLHRLISPTWVWPSGYTEKLGTRGIVAAGYKNDSWQTAIDSDGSLWRGRGEYAIGNYLSVFGDIVSVEWQSIRRAGFGVSLHLSPITINYTRLFFSETSTNADNDIFGVSITL